MRSPSYSDYVPPVGGMKQHLPELTDQCRARNGQTHPEHTYPAAGAARCRRCGAHELEPEPLAGR
ncbi:hypothetical protein [Streptomyces rhizosphaericus]|uniref:hypothetical protein n=1 Tax=Streptomyces rhizosphaericus TaxID=114699 RepID=UPI000A3BDE06|nr:hypothetical protein [Streptomyces rhizosphaericus]